MEWNVYIYNINKRKIEKFNVFEHYSFVKYVKKYLNDCKTKEEFAEHLESELRFYFWSKAEWEVLVSPWVGGDREKDTVKIDVYNQVMCNFDVFVNYVWNNKESFKS